MNFTTSWNGKEGLVEVGDEELRTYVFTIIIRPEDNLVIIKPGRDRMVCVGHDDWKNELTIEVSPRFE